ncbi:aromatic-L-amino-acid decarboxylase-like [Symsagittifera roscoffensis]|uniref:aromatic-L-amino-acid decarboxylase-like n=1 Tax=Symsagittifera roscoffensis TaxID=84072 RepID=UPI00307C1C9E
MPGVTHWHHQNFYAYFPTVGYNSFFFETFWVSSQRLWASSPACTELKSVIMDWLAKEIGLPEHFWSSSDSGGGVVIHSTASEATMFVARDRDIKDGRKCDFDLILIQFDCSAVWIKYKVKLKHIRTSIQMADYFANLVTSNDNFELFRP